MTQFIDIATGEAVEVDVPVAPGDARLVFRVRRREIGADGGVSVELHGAESGELNELLRFDLFRHDPHFHIPATTSQPTGRLEPGDHSQVVARVVERVGSELADWLREAGQPALADAIGPAPWSHVADDLRDAVAAAPEPDKRITVELTAEVRRAIGL